jgi:hypothetical protein
VDEVVTGPFILVIFRVPLRIISRHCLISCRNWKSRFPFRYPVSISFFPLPSSSKGPVWDIYLSDNRPQLWLPNLVLVIFPEKKDLISVTVRPPLTLLGAFGHQTIFWVLVSQENLGSFCKEAPRSVYLACICSAILCSLLGKRKVEYTGLHFTFPPFYRTYLIEEWYYN